MRCVICKHGETQPGLVTVTLERGESIVIIKRVPADVCNNCGEYYLSDAITEQVLERAEVAVSNGAEVEIIRYAAQSYSNSCPKQGIISKRRGRMENIGWLDLAAGGLALLILIGGLAMLFSGVAAFGEKDKQQAPQPKMLVIKLLRSITPQIELVFAIN